MAILLGVALAVPVFGSGCAAFHSRHVSFVSTSSYLRISKDRKDNLLYHGKPLAYVLAPIGLPALLALDLLLLPVTFINDAVQTIGGAPDIPPTEGSFPHRYRRAVHSVIAVR